MPLNNENFFEEQCIFITGATGFLGLALVLKLVRRVPCPSLILLVRGGEKRFWQFAASALPTEQYDSLIFAARWISVLDGDIQKVDIGLDPETLAEVKQKATIYIHAASSINLRRSLSSIAQSVLEPSLRIADIALDSPRLKTFVYVSTAYVNAHLHQTHNGIETQISECIYPLSPRSGTSPLFEYTDLQSSGTSPEFAQNSFPFPYAYAKHLTERLLIHRFSTLRSKTAMDTSAQLLIIRPSIIGPSLREPFPGYEIRGSAPITSCMAAMIVTPSLHVNTSSRFPRAYDQSTLDEVPVDIVVNRIVCHTAAASSDRHYSSSSNPDAVIIHAVAGHRGCKSTCEVFEMAMAHRRIPWHPRMKFKDIDWHDKSLHPVMQMFKIVGTAFCFEEDRTEEVWARMTDEERLIFPLFVDTNSYSEDVKEDEEEQSRKRRVKSKKTWKIIPSVSISSSTSSSSVTIYEEGEKKSPTIENRSRKPVIEDLLKKWLSKKGVPKMLTNPLAKVLVRSPPHH